MKLHRIKSIDIFRGLCMTWMVINHLIAWWLPSGSSWLHNVTIMILDSIGVSGFLFVSGVSITLSFRQKQIKSEGSGESNERITRNSHFIRAFLIFLVAIIYNLPTTIVEDPSYIWTWFVLLTVAVSMFLIWPLFFTPKIFRIILGISIIIGNQFLISFLKPYEGNSNFFGIFYYILYHGSDQDPLLSFFPFFLFGTVFGDFIFTSYLNNSSDHKKQDLTKRKLISLILIGFLLILFGLFFNFPEFLRRQSFSWMFYSMGIDTLLLSLLLLLENYNIFKRKKSYKLLFYYSYYSLTIYLSHNLLYFIFLKSLNPINIWFFIFVTFILVGLSFRFVYKNVREKASLKIQISRLSLSLALKIENRRLKRNKK